MRMRTRAAAFRLALALLLVPVLKAFAPVATAAAETAKALSNTQIIGRELFTTYLLPFEITSVLLLAAMIGAVILVKKRS